MQCDIFQEYDYATRTMIQDKYNLSREQCNILVQAYDHIAFIGGLVFRSNVEKEDVRYWNDNHYDPLPQAMRTIVYKIPKDDFHKYFSPFNFKQHFERFVKSVLDQKITSGAEILGQGSICYKRPVAVTVTESRY